LYRSLVKDTVQSNGWLTDFYHVLEYEGAMRMKYTLFPTQLVWLDPSIFFFFFSHHFTNYIDGFKTSTSHEESGGAKKIQELARNLDYN